MQSEQYGQIPRRHPSSPRPSYLGLTALHCGVDAEACDVVVSLGFSRIVVSKKKAPILVLVDLI
jgi:hypothetical protein